MAEVVLSIGGRPHPVACRDGEEAHLAALGRRIDERWAVALRAAGGINGERAMLFVALMLADALEEAENRPPTPGSASAGQLGVLADRLERLAGALEEALPSD